MVLPKPDVVDEQVQAHREDEQEEVEDAGVLAVDEEVPDQSVVNRLGVKWFETRSVSSSRKSEISGRPRYTRPTQPVEEDEAGERDDVGV